MGVAFGDEEVAALRKKGDKAKLADKLESLAEVNFKYNNMTEAIRLGEEAQETYADLKDYRNEDKAKRQLKFAQQAFAAYTSADAWLPAKYAMEKYSETGDTTDLFNAAMHAY